MEHIERAHNVLNFVVYIPPFKIFMNDHNEGIIIITPTLQVKNKMNREAK